MCSYVQYLTLPTWRAGSTLHTFVPKETEEGGCRQVIHRSDCFKWRHLVNDCGLPFGPGVPSIPSTPVLPSVPLTPGTPSAPLTPGSPKDVKRKDVGSRTLLYCSLMLGREGDRGCDSNLACVWKMLPAYTATETWNRVIVLWFVNGLTLWTRSPRSAVYS